jgi:hypothetical protein
MEEQPDQYAGGETRQYDESLRSLQQAVENAAARLHRDGLLKPGAIVFRVAEGQSAAVTLLASESGVEIQPGGDQAAPLLEVIGDPRRLEAILLGRKDAQMQYFAGGILVQGDMHYLSELGMQLGFLKQRIV